MIPGFASLLTVHSHSLALFLLSLKNELLGSITLANETRRENFRALEMKVEVKAARKHANIVSLSSIE